MQTKRDAQRAAVRRRTTGLALGVLVVVGGLVTVPGVLADGSRDLDRAVPGTGPTSSATSADSCGTLQAEVPKDLTQRDEVDELAAQAPHGKRVTFSEASLTREVSLITGSEPVDVERAPAGLRRTQTTFRGHPATELFFPSGDRILYWEDSSARRGCEGFQVVAVGLTDAEHERLISSLEVAR